MRKKNLTNFSYTLGANIINLLGGLVSVLLIPRVLDINEYAYLKIFTLYLTYVGIFHFGFNDGIYVRFGSYHYKDLDKKKFSAYFRFLLVFQSIICITVILLSIITVDFVKKSILIVIALNIFLVNISGFFSFIAQVTKEFKVYSYSIIIGKVTYVIGTIMLITMGTKSHVPFMWINTLGNLLAAIILLIYYKEIILHKASKILDISSDIKDNFKVGFFIMIGNFVTLALLGLDRIFVERLFDLEQFAMYSFAFSIITMFYMITNTLGTVIYPYITRFKREELGECYALIKDSSNIILAITLVGYFFVNIFIRVFLPNYESSLNIIRVLTPTILVSGQITVTVLNYYKAMNLQKEYILNNIIALILAVIFNVVGYLLYKDAISIAWASLLVFIVWNIYSDIFFSKKLNINLIKGNILQLTIILSFIVLTSMKNLYISGMIYILTIVILFTTYYYSKLKLTITKIK